MPILNEQNTGNLDQFRTFDYENLPIFSEKSLDLHIKHGFWMIFQLLKTTPVKSSEVE